MPPHTKWQRPLGVGQGRVKMDSFHSVIKVAARDMTFSLRCALRRGWIGLGIMIPVAGDSTRSIVSQAMRSRTL